MNTKTETREEASARVERQQMDSLNFMFGKILGVRLSDDELRTHLDDARERLAVVAPESQA